MFPIPGTVMCAQDQGVFASHPTPPSATAPTNDRFGEPCRPSERPSRAQSGPSLRMPRMSAPHPMRTPGCQAVNDSTGTQKRRIQLVSLNPPAFNLTVHKSGAASHQRRRPNPSRQLSPNHPKEKNPCAPPPPGVEPHLFTAGNPSPPCTCLLYTSPSPRD